MKKFKTLILSAALVMGIVALPTATVFAEACTGSAVDCAEEGVKGISDGSGNPDDLQKNIKTIVNVMLFILGAIAVIMIIIGGIRYATSGGDASSVKGAKDTILYAVIGLVVAILAYAIVNFILGAFK